MYIKHNDYELVYLIKEGSNKARELLFDKYGVLIRKIYREGFYSQKYHLFDFLQEGFLVLEKVIYSFNMNYTFNFYSYFTLCFSRRLLRLNITGDVIFNEKSVKYKFVDTVDVKTNLIRKLIEREIENEDDLTKKIINECIFENLSVHSFCSKYDLNYTNTYYLYRKIRLKLEKILTN